MCSKRVMLVFEELVLQNVAAFVRQHEDGYPIEVSIEYGEDDD